LDLSGLKRTEEENESDLALDKNMGTGRMELFLDKLNTIHESIRERIVVHSRQIGPDNSRVFKYLCHERIKDLHEKINHQETVKKFPDVI